MDSKTTTEKDTEQKASLNHLRLIGPLVVPYKKHILLALLLLVLGAAANLAIPVTFKLMIDLGFAAENQDTLSYYFLLVFVVSSLMILFTSLRYYWVSWIGQRVVTDLRKKVYGQVMTQSQEFFEKTKTGEILSRINTDTTLVETVVGSTFSIALRSAVTFLGALIMMVVSSPKLAMYMGFLIPLVVIPIVLTGRKIQQLSKAEQDRIADSSALATETINAMHTVQSYAQEANENHKFVKAINNAFKAAVASIRMTTIMSLLVGFVIFGGIVFVLWLGAKDVINGVMTAGTLSQFVMYAIMAATSVGALSTVWSELKKAAGALERIIELMNTESTIKNPLKPEPIKNPVLGNIGITGLHFAYPSRLDLNVLKDISFEVVPGQTVALVGPSGSGKSTLFQLLMRFYEPQSGSIKLDGTDIKNLDLDQLRSQFSLVAQDVTIFSTSARENIAYGNPMASDEAVVAAAQLAHADEFISQLEKGYDTYLGERGVRLSGGQAQRLSIARAVLTDPPVLLLDEATSALDASSEKLVQDALNSIMKNRTTLVIAHRLATIRKADQIIVMDQGQIVAKGKHEQLIRNNDLYAELAKLQFSPEE
ncbi:ABC transporter transmembrane domain-containing protein [Marinicella sp. S1101]|uniref:ABC transporter transmembrane domain-containing protein n=1 Tax=Marinicella marina TaxID=2996016 RepID=UPI002260EF61|nr:ABC transporter transmembrane domain-containing protein [Marinicella marina]MCX7553189.1 ABC transporter transmembrane domain-containing protein [Marinicella marina]MDJ1138921.1 ABC transporter transmembrane domain-containing protein [Marinicella marina]